MALIWQDFFTYEEGKLFNRVARKAISVGTRAGSLNRDGYRTVSVSNCRTQEHRIIYEMFNGPILPGLVIDHIDGNRSNNLIENLRAVTSGTNIRSGRAWGKSTFRGVSPVKNRPGVWRSRPRHGNKLIFLGYFTDEADAATAYNLYVLNHIDPLARVNETPQPWLEEAL